MPREYQKAIKAVYKVKKKEKKKKHQPNKKEPLFVSLYLLIYGDTAAPLLTHPLGCWMLSTVPALV